MLWAGVETEWTGGASLSPQTKQQPSPGNTRFIEALFGLDAAEQSLLRRSITDRSHNRRFEKQYKPLDYLGDAVLTLALRAYGYAGDGLFSCSNFEPVVQELVKNAALTAAGRATGLDRVILFERNGVLIRDPQKLSDRLVADIVEATTGAAFLSSGLDAAMRGARALFADRIQTIPSNHPESNLLDTPAFDHRSAPTKAHEIERLLGTRLQDQNLLARLVELSEHERAKVFNRLISIGVACAAVIRREHTFDEVSRLKEFPIEESPQSGDPYGIHPPKRLRSFARRIGPAAAAALSEAIGEGGVPVAPRRAACALLGIVLRDSGYDAAKRLALR